MAALATHDIQSPASYETILQKRLNLAFSDKILGKDRTWCEIKSFTTKLNEFKLTFEDFRNSLETAIRTLAMIYKGRALIPSMAGTNLRQALTLYRSIMKAIHGDELFRLSQGIPREHNLIKCLAMENFTCYFESRSRIRNLFNTDEQGLYFTKLLILEIIRRDQRGTSGDDYIIFKDLMTTILEAGVTKQTAIRELWHMITGEISLIDLEGTEEQLPDHNIKYIEDVPLEIGLRLSTVGFYYLDWLIFDLAYLECVMQDTLLPVDLARQLGKRINNLEERFDAVLKFVDYLNTVENVERSAYSGFAFIDPIMPRIKSRLEIQKRSLF